MILSLFRTFMPEWLSCLCLSSGGRSSLYHDFPMCGGTMPAGEVPVILSAGHCYRSHNGTTIPV
jgi:hypothetical protein